MCDPVFTPREKEIIDLASLGLTQREMARRLGLSPKTVSGHWTRIYLKTMRLPLPSRSKKATQE